MYCYTSACLKGRLFCATCFIFSRLSPSLKDLFTFSSPLSPLLTPQPSFISIWLLQLLGIPHWAPPPPKQHSSSIQSASSNTDRRTDGQTRLHSRKTHKDSVETAVGAYPTLLYPAYKFTVSKFVCWGSHKNVHCHIDKFNPVHIFTPCTSIQCNFQYHSAT